MLRQTTQSTSLLLKRQLSSAAKPYPKLLEPLKLTENVTLRNRVLMGSMHTGLEEPGGFFSSKGLDEMAEFYAERAKGGVGLIVTGGISPNNAGRGYFGAAKMSTPKESALHKVVTQAVHEHNGKIAMQILHTGRYAYHPWGVAPSPIKAPIGWFTPKELSSSDVRSTISDFVKCATLAQQAGYDGVEIMGSEGYLINQFLVKRTNKRKDEWGGDYVNRIKFPTEIVKQVRAATGKDFIIVYRLSMLDLVEDGSSWEEIAHLANEIKAAGASIINTGIGWHEARVPTIATMVPRGAFTWVTKKLKDQLNGVPLCTTNRINNPEVAEQILADGCADMVSMARPLLADPDFVNKAAANQANEINTCIGCNQACLDHIFLGKKASCLVNPRAAYESTLQIKPVAPGKKQKVAVVGAGPAGLAFAVTAAQRGHDVTLYDKDSEIGGQFNLAKRIPGKEEFYETIRYFNSQLVKYPNLNVKLNTLAAKDDLVGYDSVVLATGVHPRKVDIPVKTDKVAVHSYYDVLKGKVKTGERVAVIGAGGIGFDMCEFLLGHGEDKPNGPLVPKVEEHRVKEYLSEWGIDTAVSQGGLLKQHSHKVTPAKKLYLLQRKPGRLGTSLGKTTGWIHKAQVKRHQVEELGGCKYVEINDEGLVIEQKQSSGKGKGKSDDNAPAVKRTLPVDTVVICAGQVSSKELYDPLVKAGKNVFLIGGSQEASELDAKRAIDQGTRLAAVLEDAKTGDVYSAPVESNTKIMDFVRKLVGKA